MAAQPLDTSNYDTVVVIDTQVVLESRPLEQLPWADLFDGRILLLVCRQVQSELDAKKNDGRLGKRARAFNALLDGFIGSRVPSPVSAVPHVDVALVSSGRIEWDALDDLESDDGDDRIVAQMMHALVDDPTRLILLSHDMRPRDAAATHGLRAVKLPEGWLREPEPSPDQKRINELEGKVRLLSADQPVVAVRIEATSPRPWRRLEVTPAASDAIRRILERELAAAPEPSKRDAFGIGGLSHDYTHAERLAEWRRRMHLELPLIHDGLTRLFSQHRFKVSIENTGTVPAEGLSLEIRSGNASIHAVPFWVLVSGPPAPQAKNLGDRLRHVPVNVFPTARGQFTYHWDQKGPGRRVGLSCASFRQEKVFEVEVSVELLAGSPPRVQLEAVVTAANLKGDARTQLIIDVERVGAAFDEVYDADAGVLVVRPPYDPPVDFDPDDIKLYGNDGALVELD